MKVKFFDKERATYVVHEKVVHIEITTIICNGRLRKVWELLFEDNHFETFKYRDFDLINVSTLI